MHNALIAITAAQTNDPVDANNAALIAQIEGGADAGGSFTPRRRVQTHSSTCSFQHREAKNEARSPQANNEDLADFPRPDIKESRHSVAYITCIQISHASFTIPNNDFTNYTDF